jgi:O-6-methylguanine DNA methyltransferase
MVPKINTATFCFRETLPAVTGTEKYAGKSLLLKAVYSDEGLRELMVFRDNLKLPPQQNLETLKNPAKARERYKQLRKLLPSRLRGKKAELKWEAFDLRGRGEFHTRIWKATHAIPTGHTASYAEVAGDVGSPLAFRACGQACGANPILIFIPCHRVVASNGLGGFGCDLELKKHMLALEGIDWKTL